MKNPQRIIKDVCRKYGITQEELKGTQRYLYFVRARKEVSVLLKEQLGLSSLYIGKLLNKDHSTILHYWKNES